MSIADATVNLNGDPTKLRVYLKGGTIDPGNGSHSGDFTGILWAPIAGRRPTRRARPTGAAGSCVNTFTCNGGPHLQVHYDTRMLVDHAVDRGPSPTTPRSRRTRSRCPDLATSGLFRVGIAAAGRALLVDVDQ